MLRLAFTLLLGLAPSSVVLAQAPASAKPASSPERAAFNRLADGLVGSWDCAIRELDPEGKEVWSDNQVRTFAVSFGGNAIEERAYQTQRLDSADNVGMHVLLRQSPGLRVTQYGIWPGGAARMFVVDGTLRSDGSGVDGTMVATDEKGVEDRRRVVIGWLTADSHYYRVYSKTPSGAEYLREELVYRRRPKA